MSFFDESKKKASAELKQHLAALLELKIQTVHVAFSGYGDEGSITEIIYNPELPEGNSFDRSGFDEALYNYLDPAHVGDWVNNEGGFGTIEINVKTGKIKGEINFNETTYSTEKYSDTL